MIDDLVVATSQLNFNDDTKDDQAEQIVAAGTSIDDLTDLTSSLQIVSPPEHTQDQIHRYLQTPTLYKKPAETAACMVDDKGEMWRAVSGWSADS